MLRILLTIKFQNPTPLRIRIIFFLWYNVMMWLANCSLFAAHSQVGVDFIPNLRIVAIKMPTPVLSLSKVRLNLIVYRALSLVDLA